MPNLCGSTANLTTFISYLNTALDLTVQSINEELGVEFTIPGVTPIPLPGMPGIALPKQDSFDVLRKLHQTQGVRGYVGNVHPVDVGGKGVENNATYPGWPTFMVEGLGGFVVPGIDPSTHIINLMNTNYQILAELLLDEGVTWEQTPIPQVDLCGGGSSTVDVGAGGGSSAGQQLFIDIVNINNQGAEEAAGGAGCVPILVFDPSSISCWTDVSGGTVPIYMTVNRTSTSISTSTAGPYSTPPFTPNSISATGNHFLELTQTYDSLCNPYPCSQGITLTFDWAFENNTHRVLADFDPGMGVSIGGRGPFDQDGQIEIIANLRRASDNSLVSGTNRTFLSPDGVSIIASVQKPFSGSPIEIPVVTFSGTDSLVWTSADVIAIGEPVFLAISFRFYYYLIASSAIGAPPSGPLGQDATASASVTNLDLIFT